jgi:hypothetical protein
MIQTY